MARISEDELTQLKDTISLQRLAEAKGIVLKRHGADLIGLCPFHDDHEPSLVISPDKNLWHCLGACQCGGTVIDWVMKSEGVSFRHAVELLRTDPSLAASSSPPVKRSTVTRLPAPIEVAADDQVLLAQVVYYYHRALLQNTEALAYLEKRGIASREAIELLELGFADRSLGYHLPHTNRIEGAAMRGRLQRIGILRASGHEHFNGSLVIPIINDDHVTEIYGRKIRDDLRPGTPMHLYLPGPHRGVWNRDALTASREIILCESLIDALTFWCAGYRNVTASYGVEGFTPDHLRDFKEYDTERVLIAYDRDAAGDAAAQALAKTLMAEGIDCYRIQFPKGMDANEYALHVTPAHKSLGVVIRAAQWMGNGAAPKRRATLATACPQDATKSENSVDDAKEGRGRATPGAVADEPPPPLPATPIPDAPQPEITAEVKDDTLNLVCGDRHYRVRGLKKNLSYEQLKVNVLVSRAESLHIDTFDLYAARARAIYIKQAAIEIGVTEDAIKQDLAKLLRQCETVQEQQIRQTLAPVSASITLSETERAQAMQLLQDPQLLERLLTDFSRCGVVGEETNKLVGYLAAVSRKLSHPLAILIQSTSAAGKTALMDAVLALMPEEERVQYSAMTGQSLFYMGETNLKHKILAIAEEEGAHQAAYALKLLQSEGQLTIASTGKDPDSGKHITHEYTVEGPVMIFLTTTAIEIDDELLNRCIVLTVDEQRTQTQAIHAVQRQQRTLDGLLAKADKARLLTVHRNAQRLLQTLAVVNPYAEHLTFLDDRTRMRRDHEKYLTLIDAIALLHQHQRPIKTVPHNGEMLRYIEVTLDDIAHANRLAHDVLGRSLDELPPQTRRLLLLTDALVSAQTQTLSMQRCDYRFSRRQLREHSGWGDTQLKIHLHRLVELEYLLIHRGPRGNSFSYELLYDGQGKEGQPFLPGLIDVEQLKHNYDANRSGQNAQRSGSGRPPVGDRSGGGRSRESDANPATKATSADAADDDANHSYPVTATKSYRSHRPALVGKGRN